MGIHRVPATTGYRYAQPGDFALNQYYDDRARRAHRQASKSKEDYEDRAKGGDDFQTGTLNTNVWSHTGGNALIFGGDSGVMKQKSSVLVTVLDVVEGGGTAFVTSLQRNTIMEFYTKLSQTIQTRVQLGWKNADTAAEVTTNYLIFENNAAASAVNWFGKSDNAATPGSVDLGVLADTKYHLFRIEIERVTGVAYFWIDGKQRGSIAKSLLPVGTLGLFPHLSINEIVGSVPGRILNTDSCYWWQDRPTS